MRAKPKVQSPPKAIHPSSKPESHEKFQNLAIKHLMKESRSLGNS